jgi:hypothetical protein
MLTLEMEVVSPETVEVAGEEINIGGVKTKNYYVTTILKDDGSVDEKATAEQREKYLTGVESGLLPRLGIDPATINWDNIDAKGLFEGKLVLTQMSPDIEPQRKNPTSAQIAAAKKMNTRPEGDVQKHPITGKTLINYWPKVREVFGLATSQGTTGQPY